MSGSYFSNNGTDLYYSVEGTGAPILLIHGWACDQNDWSFQIVFLLSLGFQVIAADLRGHGHSRFTPHTKHHHHPYLLDPTTMASDLAALLTHLNITTPTLIAGHSLGGVVANEFLLHHPSLARGLVLVDPAYYMTPAAMSHAQSMLDDPPAFNATSVGQAATAFWDEAKVYPANASALLRPWAQRRAWAMDGGVVRGAFKQMSETLGGSGVEYLRRTTRPGAGGGGVPRLITCSLPGSADVEREAGLQEGVDVVEVFAEGGHFHHLVEPEKYNALLGGWLRDRGFLPSGGVKKE